MSALESFVAGRWLSGRRDFVDLQDATTAEVIFRVSSEGVDFASMLAHARGVGGPNLRALTFHQRAALLKALAKYLTEHKEALYSLSYATGATQGDAWIDIDGGISTLFVYASKGTRELPNDRVLVDGSLEGLSRNGTFVGQHIRVPLEGAAIHINAFNFPVWGLLEKLAPALLRTTIGDPRLDQVKMGPLASAGQRREVLTQLSKLQQEAHTVLDGKPSTVVGADGEKGAFVAPALLYCKAPRSATRIHSVEAFGPVCTVVPYSNVEDAVSLSRRGGGSLVSSVFTADETFAADVVVGLAPFHGRVLVVNRHCAKESTGHGSPLPHLVHGGPGRAGGGEEMGGTRGVMHYMQRTAVQGTPDVITAVTRRWAKGARQLDPGVHPFQKPFGSLCIGDTFNSAERLITLEDIERFAELSGDRFYAHMDEEQARRNPLFGGRVAHGYFLVSAAAGLFVHAPYGPVLANYGIDGLRFTQPVKPGDRIKVRLTCKEKSLRAGTGYGEVRWDTEITNQANETVASYDVLTMVSEKLIPDS